MNKVRFPSAVKAGDEVRVVAAIASLTPHPAGDLVAVDYTVTADGADRPACVAQTLTLLLR